MTIGEHIKKFRTAHGISQKELAEAGGVSIGAVSAWEQDRNTPRQRVLIKLVKHFNVPMEEIIGEQLFPDTLELGPGATGTKPFYTQEEARLILQYRKLSQRGKNTVQAVIQAQLGHQTITLPAVDTIREDCQDFLMDIQSADPELVKELRRYFNYLKGIARNPKE